MAERRRQHQSNGHVKETIQDPTTPRENIFLFVPNLIGRTAISHDKQDEFLTMCRIFESCSSDRFTLFYAIAPATMFVPVQRVMSSGCSGRLCGTQVAAIYEIWSSTGYGDRSLHDDMSARLFGNSETSVEHSFPAADQLGLHQSLYAHVCDSGHGRKW